MKNETVIIKTIDLFILSILNFCKGRKIQFLYYYSINGKNIKKVE